MGPKGRLVGRPFWSLYGLKAAVTATLKREMDDRRTTL